MTSPIVVIDFAGTPAAFTLGELRAAQARAADLLGTPKVEHVTVTNSPTPDLIDGRELARRTNLPLSYVMEQARRGVIPSVKLGRYRRFKIDALAGFGSASDQLSVHQQAGAESLKNKALPKGRYQSATKFSSAATPPEGRR